MSSNLENSLSEHHCGILHAFRSIANAKMIVFVIAHNTRTCEDFEGQNTF